MSKLWGASAAHYATLHTIPTGVCSTYTLKPMHLELTIIYNAHAANCEAMRSVFPGLFFVQTCLTSHVGHVVTRRLTSAEITILRARFVLFLLRALLLFTSSRTACCSRVHLRENSPHAQPCGQLVKMMVLIAVWLCSLALLLCNRGLELVIGHSDVLQDIDGAFESEHQYGAAATMRAFSCDCVELVSGQRCS